MPYDLRLRRAKRKKKESLLFADFKQNWNVFVTLGKDTSIRYYDSSFSALRAAACRHMEGQNFKFSNFQCTREKILDG